MRPFSATDPEETRAALISQPRSRRSDPHIGTRWRPRIKGHCAPVHYERHRPEQTPLYRLVQQHAATFFAEAEDAACADLP